MTMCRSAVVKRAAVVAGMAAYVPSRLVKNSDLVVSIDTSDEWIRTRTGIEQRYMAGVGTSTSDLAVEAGRLALRSAGVTAVDTLILATSTPDYTCPATAPAVAARLELGNIAAFDLAAVCSGFLYSMASANALIVSGMAESVLLIGADTFTRIVNPKDRGTAIIFGDGAGGMVLRAGCVHDPRGVFTFDMGADGDHVHLFHAPAGGSRQRSASCAVDADDRFVVMQGRKLFQHAVNRITSSCQSVLVKAGWGVSDVDLMVPHQANLRITSAVAARLGLSADRAYSNIAHVGNTAAASLPIALTDAVMSGRLKSGHHVLLAAFGAGLTWAAATLIWPDVQALSNRTNPQGETDV